jgi:hypothetical protein
VLHLRIVQKVSSHRDLIVHIETFKTADSSLQSTAKVQTESDNSPLAPTGLFSLFMNSIFSGEPTENANTGSSTNAYQKEPSKENLRSDELLIQETMPQNAPDISLNAEDKLLADESLPDIAPKSVIELKKADENVVETGK